MMAEIDEDPARNLRQNGPRRRCHDERPGAAAADHRHGACTIKCSPARSPPRRCIGAARSVAAPLAPGGPQAMERTARRRFLIASAAAVAAGPRFAVAQDRRENPHLRRADRRPHAGLLGARKRDLQEGRSRRRVHPDGERNGRDDRGRLAERTSSARAVRSPRSSRTSRASRSSSIANGALWEVDNAWAIGVCATDSNAKTGADLNGDGRRDRGSQRSRPTRDQRLGRQERRRLEDDQVGRDPELRRRRGDRRHRIDAVQLNEPQLSAALESKQVRTLAKFLGCHQHRRSRSTIYLSHPDWAKRTSASSSASCESPTRPVHTPTRTRRRPRRSSRNARRCRSRPSRG